MSLPIKKLYIDTKYKSRESVSNSNFKIDLPQTLLFPDNTVFYIDDISIPHSWHTVEENVNDKLYIMVSPLNPNSDNTGVEWIIATISPGNYNGVELAVELETKMQSSINNSFFPNLLKSSYNSKKNSISIYHDYADWKFKVLTDDDIYTKLNDTWLGASYDNSNPHSINDIIGNHINNSPFYTSANPYSGALNLQPIRNIYIHSSLGNYNTMSNWGSQAIVKKVPVTANSGDYIFDQVMTGNDFGDCSKQTLRTVSFELKDVHGNYVNLHGNNLSLSIIFSRMNPEI